MSRLRDLASGFTRTFWVANTLELVERFAFYGAKAVLTIYLAERVGLGAQAAGSLAGLFSGVLYCLPILAGPIVDRYGFKKSLAACLGGPLGGWLVERCVRGPHPSSLGWWIAGIGFLSTGLMWLYDRFVAAAPAPALAAKGAEP